MKILYLIYLKIILSEHEITHGSAILKSNKLYVYEPADYNLKDSTLTVYDLKDGPISQIANTAYKITNTPNSYTPKFLKLPQGLQNGDSDQIWLMGGQCIYKRYDQSIYDNMWTGQFVNSTNIRFDNSFIKKPDFDNFPNGGFSQDIVLINNKPVMYIIGGFFYSADKKTNIFTSSMFKYDFTSNSWSDLSASSNSILPPIADHQTVVVDNFLLVTNGMSPNFTTTQYPQTAPYNSSAALLNYYDKAYKFDLLSQKWSSIIIKTNLDENIYRKGHIMSHMHGASLNLYKNSLITYTLLYNLKTFIHEPKLAVLDYNNWEWRWHRIDTDTGIDNNLQLAFHQSMIIKDQLLLIHGYANQPASKKLFVINLTERKLSSILNFSGNSVTDAGLPTYLIVIITIVVLVVLLSISAAYYIFVYKRRSKERKNRNLMQEIWAAEHVDINIHNSAIDSNRSANNTLNSNSITTNGISSKEIFDNDASAISRFECFQYNSDFIDMGDSDEIKPQRGKISHIY